MSGNYHFCSLRTKYYIVSNGQEKVDQEVETVQGSSSIPDNTVVTVTPPIGTITLCNVKGKAGLYVGIKG
ncbi:hypothetical protein AX17_005000, partial [Amanita inopinata Kibby_2008]